MPTLREVERACASVAETDGLAVLDARLRPLAERAPAPEGHAVLIVLGEPDLDGLDASARPDASSGPTGGALGGLRALAACTERPSENRPSTQAVPGVFEIHDFRKGRKTRRGEPLPSDEAPEPELVTAVARREIDRFLGARDRRERTAHLRRLRDEGVLVHNRNRLTQIVRGPVTGGERVHAYVFRGPWWAVPRCLNSGHD